jgi:myo-inositol-1(or 4)-monophosphatase
MSAGDPTTDPSAAEPSDDALLALAESLARAAGALALRGRRGGLDDGQDHDLDQGTKSTSTDLVTRFDRLAEALLVDRLRRERPDDAIVGEEGAAVPGTSGYSWLLDPIDGTTNFVYDLPSWSTSVAVAHHGTTVAGAVYVPVTDELYAARRGGGATLDGRPLAVTSCTDLSLALVATGFAYRAETRRAQATRVARMIAHVRDVRRLGSAAIDLCHVAAGRVDAYFEEHLNPWDAAAGELIAREAGAVTSDLRGGPAVPASLVAAAPGVHAALLDLIADADGATS